MKIENPLKMIRELKGAPMSVLLALAIVRQPVKEIWLVSVTGYTENTVRSALRYLTEVGYVKQISGQSWQIANSFQLPLMDVKPSIFEGLPATTTAININNSNNLRAVVVEKEKPQNLRVLPEKIGVYDRLKSIGVGEPNRSRLANMEHITLDYLNAHYEHWKLENKPLGLLIHRLRSCDPAPKRINQDDYRRYTKGKYGKYGIR